MIAKATHSRWFVFRKPFIWFFLFLSILTIFLCILGYGLQYKFEFEKNNFSDHFQFSMFRLFNSPDLAPSQHIDKKILKTKIEQGLPLWANQQIEKDLAPYHKIKKRKLRSFFLENQHRLKIVYVMIHQNQVKILPPGFFSYIKNSNSEKNNRVQAQGEQHDDDPFNQISNQNYETYYVNYKNIWQQADWSYAVLLEVLEYLTKQQLLPDVEFILGLWDYLALPKSSPLPFFTFAKDLNKPLEKNLILFPDWMNLRSIYSLKKEIQASNKSFPWQNKKEILLWRGGHYDSTGFRKTLVDFAKHYPQWIDAKFADNKMHPDYIAPKDQLAYQYLIAIDGERCTWERLVWQLHSNSLVMKPNSSQTQWFYQGLEAKRHFWPIDTTQDILTSLEIFKQNQDQIQIIIKNANEFAEQNLSLEAMFHYIVVLLNEYSKKIDQNDKII